RIILCSNRNALNWNELLQLQLGGESKLRQSIIGAAPCTVPGSWMRSDADITRLLAAKAYGAVLRIVQIRGPHRIERCASFQLERILRISCFIKYQVIGWR